MVRKKSTFVVCIWVVMWCAVPADAGGLFLNEVGTPVMGNAGGWAPMMGSFFVHPINEDLRFGFSFVSLSGAVLDYDRGWTGRYQNEKVELITMTATPTLAYRVSDWLSVGGGPVITYGMLEMDAAVDRGNQPDGQATIDGDDTDVGYTLSAMFELSEQTRIGVVYLSEIEVDLEGDRNCDLPA